MYYATPVYHCPIRSFQYHYMPATFVCVLDFISHNCKVFIKTTDIHLVFTLMRLYSSLMDEIAESGKEDKPSMPATQITLWLQSLFLFSLVWSLGSTMNCDSRRKFDEFFRDLINGTNEKHPKPKSVKLTKVQECMPSLYTVH